MKHLWFALGLAMIPHSPPVEIQTSFVSVTIQTSTITCVYPNRLHIRAGRTVATVQCGAPNADGTREDREIVLEEVMVPDRQHPNCFAGVRIVNP